MLECEDWNPDSLLNADILGTRSDDLREHPLLWMLAKLEEFLPYWSGLIILPANSASSGWFRHSSSYSGSILLKQIGHSEYRNMHSKHLPCPHWLSKLGKIRNDLIVVVISLLLIDILFSKINKEFIYQ